MMRPTYTQLDVFHGVVQLQDDANDHAAGIPVRSIVSWDVDWTRAGGELTIITSQATGTCGYTVLFEAGDSGQACADATTAIFTALKEW